MEQFFHHVLVSNISAPFDFIMPSIKNFKPLMSTHYEVGWKHYMRIGIIELSAYYKRRNNLLAFRPNSFIENSRWDKYIMAGNGESYGLNLYMFNQWHRLSWQLSYGFSKSREWYAELPQLGKIPSLFDLPHSFNAFFSYKMFRHSTFTIGGTVYSGKFPLRLVLRRRKQSSRDLPHTTRPHTLQNRRKLRFQEGIQAFQILPPLRTLQHSGQSVERRAFVQLLVQAERRLHSFRCNNLQILTLFRRW